MPPGTPCASDKLQRMERALAVQSAKRLGKCFHLGFIDSRLGSSLPRQAGTAHHGTCRFHRHVPATYSAQRQSACLESRNRTRQNRSLSRSALTIFMNFRDQSIARTRSHRFWHSIPWWTNQTKLQDSKMVRSVTMTNSFTRLAG